MHRLLCSLWSFSCQGRFALLAALTFSALALPAQVHADTLYNNAAGADGTIAGEPNAPHVLQLITLAPPTAAAFTITSFTVGVDITTTAEQFLILDLYTGVDTSPTSTDALANATKVMTEIGYDLVNPTVGLQSYTIPLPSPVTITNTTNGTFGFELSVTDNQFQYSTTSGVVLRLGGTGPSVGSAANYVWNDADATTASGGTFTGAEQTTFGSNRAGIYVSVAGNVPEPGTTGLCLLGVGVFGGVLLRRRWRAA